MNTYLLYPTATSQVGQHVKCLIRVSSSFDHTHAQHNIKRPFAFHPKATEWEVPYHLENIQLCHSSGLGGFLLKTNP